jgi:hypothetical protein
MKDQIQEVDILVAPVLFDGVVVRPIPCLKLVERNVAFDQSRELPTEIRQ